jgi:hypothetical protein
LKIDDNKDKRWQRNYSSAIFSDISDDIVPGSGKCCGSGHNKSRTLGAVLPVTVSFEKNGPLCLS